MSSPTPGSDPNYPQGAAPQGQPGWGAPQQPGYGAPQQPDYTPAPSYSGQPAQSGQRPGMVTAAGVIGIVWGGLGLLFGLLALAVAFTFGSIFGLLVLLSVAVSAALLWAGIQVIQGKSPRLLLLISYIAIGVNLLTMIWAIAQGASIFSGLLGFVLPGVVVFLLLNQQSKQYYASRGISY
jgi:hypothetical protein